MDTQAGTRLDQRSRAVVAAFAATTVSDALRLLVRAGVPVFPCAPDAKRPLTLHGFQDATTDPREVARWWRRWPEANLAIPTGGASGWDVVDVDVHGEESGRDAFEASLRRGLTGGWAFTVRTPSGGLHGYYPNTARQACWQVPDAHVDFRSDGGYVLVPPSRVVYDDGASGTYQLTTVTRQTPRPVDGPALRAFLSPEPTFTQRPGTTAAADAQRADPARLADWVATRPEGGRNAGLFWAACRLAEHGHDYATALATVGNAALNAGLGPREAEATIRSAFRRAQRAAHPATGRAAPPHAPGGGRRPDPPEAVFS
ncbi:bifunctional DNA primase/polymerase [Antribacter sp. KLBMP9083]|uniref:Bifunctional DNA primase/polymerase n=1 Tax=Antribacter soli TaxID=2910976 RepID=A0AA41U982_9MICO|nr:bifunctional DNA primase/polymerase [Antribacter soli]MCF4123703.1 bifunctional DNA primase/polymerase [Antribacter soli]